MSNVRRVCPQAVLLDEGGAITLWNDDPNGTHYLVTVEEWERSRKDQQRLECAMSDLRAAGVIPLDQDGRTAMDARWLHLRSAGSRLKGNMTINTTETATRINNIVDELKRVVVQNSSDNWSNGYREGASAKSKLESALEAVADVSRELFTDEIISKPAFIEIMNAAGNIAFAEHVIQLHEETCNGQSK